VSEARVLCGDCLSAMRDFAPGSFQMVCTSPPYWGLRDYGTARWEGGSVECDHKTGRFERGGLSEKQASSAGSNGDEAKSICPKCGATRVDKQLGLERVHDCLGWATGQPCGSCYVCHLVAVFREVKRVLRDDGVLFLNIGDSYASGKGTCYNPGGGATSLGKERKDAGAHPLDRGNKSELAENGLKPKDLCGIPWRVALALQADGWWLRSDVIWHKPNPMPESVTDRPTRSHEYIFMLTKSARYYFDNEAVKELNTPDMQRRASLGHTRGPHGKLDSSRHDSDTLRGEDSKEITANGRNLRSVWTITTKPCREAHFATFPPDIPERCIKAATSERGACPKCGKQWVRVVETTPGWSKPCPKTVAAHQARGGTGIPVGHIGTAGSSRIDPVTRTTGWRPGCECGLEPVPSSVLDVFGGAGTTAVAAVKLGRSATIVELNPAYCAIARARIEAATRQGRIDYEVKA
jgi:DNA modification methylase